jgi:hypothetical protein
MIVRNTAAAAVADNNGRLITPFIADLLTRGDVSQRCDDTEIGGLVSRTF